MAPLSVATHLPEPLLPDADRAFLQRVVRRTFDVNPFEAARLEVEQAALEDAFLYHGPFRCRRGDAIPVDVNRGRIAARLVPVLERLRAALAAGKTLSTADRTLYVEACLAHLFDVYDAAFQPIEKRAPACAVAALWHAFEADYDRLLAIPGAKLRPLPCAHLFACAYQLSRAFHYIFFFIVGTSAPAGRLRAALWRAIFGRDLRRHVRTCADQANVISTLVIGETGTGKELAARSLGLSTYVPFDPIEKRFVAEPDAGFTAINVASLAGALLESELFGHRRGAFTGAHQDRKGLLDGSAPRPVVYLDEVGDLAPDKQSSLLRVLEDRKYRRVGDTEEQPFTARVVAATHWNLTELIEAGRFRLDLYERLAGARLLTPSLLEQLTSAGDQRRDVLLELVSFFAGRVLAPDGGDAPAEDVARLTDDVDGVVQAQYADYAWPGNARELLRFVESVHLGMSFTPVRAAKPGASTLAAAGAKAAGEAAALRERLGEEFMEGKVSDEEMRGRYMAIVRARVGSDRKAAEVLGVHRSTLVAKMDLGLLEELLYGRQG